MAHDKTARKKKAEAFAGRGFWFASKNRGPSREGPRHILQLPVDAPHGLAITRHQHQVVLSSCNMIAIYRVFSQLSTSFQSAAEGEKAKLDIAIILTVYM